MICDGFSVLGSFFSRSGSEVTFRTERHRTSAISVPGTSNHRAAHTVNPRTAYIAVAVMLQSIAYTLNLVLV